MDLADLMRAIAGRQDTSAYAVPSPAPRATSYDTALDPVSEKAFRGWVAQNRVPFNPDAGAGDYDMRGFYKDMMAGQPRAQSAVDPNDKRMHYPDYYKTPSHQTFSDQSQWAAPGAPQWNSQDQLLSAGGRVLFDDRRQ